MQTRLNALFATTLTSTKDTRRLKNGGLALWRWVMRLTGLPNIVKDITTTRPHTQHRWTARGVDAEFQPTWQSRGHSRRGNTDTTTTVHRMTLHERLKPIPRTTEGVPLIIEEHQRRLHAYRPLAQPAKQTSCYRA